MTNQPVNVIPVKTGIQRNHALWMPAYAGMTNEPIDVIRAKSQSGKISASSMPTHAHMTNQPVNVIPVKTGIQRNHALWMPAYAGMTNEPIDVIRAKSQSGKISASSMPTHAHMTNQPVNVIPVKTGIQKNHRSLDAAYAGMTNEEVDALTPASFRRKPESRRTKCSLDAGVRRHDERTNQRHSGEVAIRKNQRSSMPMHANMTKQPVNVIPVKTGIQRNHALWMSAYAGMRWSERTTFSKVS